MNIKDIIRNNAKLYMILAIIIVLGTIGISLAVLTSNFNAIGVNTNMLEIDADISYDESSNGEEITSTGNMLPISDSLVTGPNVTDSRVLKATFNVTGASNNPDNTIYDIALHNLEVDCALRTKELKWRLYKGEELISREDASLSPTFDTIDDGRLVLTEIQEDLTTNTDKYTFLLWISESCDGNITECDSSKDQSDYLGKEFSASIKVELSTKSKKKIERITGSEDSCYYTEVEVPVCNTLTYNGQEQQLVNTASSSLSGISGDNNSYKILPLGISLLANTNYYNIENNIGVNAGKYAVILNLENGYKWTDGSTNEKCIYCSIDKKNVTITTLDQSVVYGNKISSGVSNVNILDLITNDTVEEVSLTSDTVDVGEGKISSNNVKIVNSVGTDVTSNYNIIKNNTGKLTITCANIAKEPTITNLAYTGNLQSGISGGTYITITGEKSATEIGEYKVTAVPNKNYCWSDKTTTSKEYTWKIESNSLNIEIEDKTTTYSGEEVTIDKVVVTDTNGKEVTDIPITYKYYSGTSCTGDALGSAPINVGSYSVKGYIEKTESYPASESNCAKLTITKASGSISASTDSLSLTYPTSSSFTYTYTGDGNISCSSSSDSIAICAVDTTNKKVTVTPVSIGSVVVTVTLAEGTNYAGASDTVSVTVGNGTLSGGSVAISGTNKYGETLTATVTDTNPTATYSYKWWYSSSSTATSGTMISGATSSTYTIGDGLIGKYIGVTVTATKTNYIAKTFSDITNSSIAKADLTSSQIVVTPYTGTYNGSVHYATIKSTVAGLTIVSGSSISYGTTVIDGTVANTSYNLSPSRTSAGTTTVYYKVTGDNYNDYTGSTTVKINTAALSGGSVVISGTNKYGETLTATVTDTNPTATYSYKWWYSSSSTATSGTTISGATSSTYTIGDGLIGKYIGVTVTATKTNYTTKTFSDITNSTIAKADLTSSQIVVTPYTGTYNGSVHYATIKSTVGGLTIVSGSSTSYGTTVIDGTVANTSYNLSPSRTSAGTTTVYYKVTGDNYNDYTGSTTVKINTAALSGGSVVISGTNTYGQTLTATVTDTNPTATYSYKWWYSSSSTATSGTTISGATSSTYTVASNYIGKYIGVTVTATKTNYTTKTFSDITNSTIAKATGSITAGVTSLSLTYPTANSFTYTYTGDGSVSCSSSSTSIATCSVDTTNKKVTVTPVATGSAVVTVTLAEGTNYAGASDTVSVSIVYDTYTVTLNNQSATSAGTTTLYGRYSDGIYLDSSYSKKMTTSANAITKPTRTGYTFGGYYTSTGGSGTQLINFSGYITSSFTTTKYSNNVTLYAKWTASSYSVTYDYATNGGTSATKTSATVSYGNSIDLSPTAAKSGWTFVGWNTNSSATTALSSLTMGTSSVKLYAIYRKEAITYTATTQKNVSSATGTAKTVSCQIPAVYNTATQNTSCSITLPSNPYTLTNWTFNGWVKSTGTTTTTISGTAVNGSMTLTGDTNIVATWKKNSSTATFYYYNGSAQTSTTTYCTMYNGASSCNLTVPSVVTSSKGPNSASYYGVATNVHNYYAVTSYPSTTTKYYAIYKSSWTASYTKGTGVSSIGSTSNSCTCYKVTDGSTYGSSSCNVTLPTITASTGYTVLGWYDSSGTKVGNAGDSLSLTANATYTAKAQVSVTLNVGDYISYTPTITSFTIDKAKTGYTGSESQILYPSELKLWRVLNKNSDGTVDIISEYTSSTRVYFEVPNGYLNYVGYLNLLASKYETSGITVGSRNFGYNGQTEYITDTNPSSLFAHPLPWQCATGESCNPVESKGGGDSFYTKDYNQLFTALGTRVAYIVNATTTKSAYWMSSRHYWYRNENLVYWGLYLVNSDGNYEKYLIGFTSTDSIEPIQVNMCLRPIVTLKSGLGFTGSGTSASPYVIT